jgi:conjugative transfer signal peptidase TraF
MKKNFSTLCVTLLVLSVIADVFFLLYGVGLRANLSKSLPGFVYRAIPLPEEIPLSHGDRVLIDLSRFSNPVVELGIERGYVSRKQKMLKEIGAIPDDSVALKDNGLYVNGAWRPMIVSSQDSRGGKLFPYPTPLTVSPDHFWLVSVPYLGFDSRYFGPVDRNAFTHMARPVF